MHVGRNLGIASAQRTCSDTPSPEVGGSPRAASAELAADAAPFVSSSVRAAIGTLGQNVSLPGSRHAPSVQQSTPSLPRGYSPFPPSVLHANAASASATVGGY